MNLLLLRLMEILVILSRFFFFFSFLDVEKYCSFLFLLSSQVEKLQQNLRPFLLRRLKEDVEKAIPPKEEVVVELEMSDMQKQYYRAILERNRSFLNRFGIFLIFF